jgi:peptidoglycan/xylan/chitin deacetylase (PgdA/CDA1 family)
MTIQRGAASLFTSVAVAAALVGCRGSERGEATCVGAQALVAPQARYFGDSLAPKQLSLTFDDGPGTRTVELSAWLKGQGIRATFFVNGQHTTPVVLQQLVTDGHIVANHTQTHASLTGESTGTPKPTAADIVREVTETDVLIAPYVLHGRFMFRAPFGDYDDDAFAALQASPMKKYVGHIEWDIGGVFAPARGTAADFACWDPSARHPRGGPGAALTSKQCGDLYVAEARALGKGIVLMHDPYGDMLNTNVEAGGGNTIDMVKYIVPILKTDGFTFVGLDEVPAIAAALPPLPADAGPDDGGPDGHPSVVGPGDEDAAVDAGRHALPIDSTVDAGTHPCPPH